MIDKLKLLVNEATWFLRSGVSPISKPEDLKKSLEELNHMASKKFAMTMIAVTIIAFMYFTSVLFLFFFPADPHVTALVSMYKDMIFAIATIVGTLVGIQGFVDWKHNSDTTNTMNSSIVQQNDVLNQNINQNLNQNIEEHIIEEYYSGPKESDYTLSIDQ